MMKWSILTILFAFSAVYSTTPEVVGLGAGIVDQCIFITDEKLLLYTQTKNDWEPISYDTLNEYLKGNETIKSPGGSCTNVLKGLSNLGVSCRLIGQIGKDEASNYFKKELRRLEIDTQLEEGNLPTGQSICFVTPDGARTMRTYLGSSHEINPNPLSNDQFNGAKWFHIEGYQLIDSKRALRALKIAKQLGLKTSLDLSSVHIVTRNKALIEEILTTQIDVIFCNELEAKAFTGLDPLEAVDVLACLCPIAVVTVGDKGSYAKQNGKKIHTPAHTITPVDTTGAGDHFAAGFIYGMLHNQTIEQCAALGTLTASHIVRVFGTHLQPESWLEIRTAMSQNNSVQM